MTVATACSAGTSGAGSNATLRVAVSVADVSIAQLWIGQVAGFYKQQNLDVTLDLVGSNTTTSVTSGQDDLAFGGMLAPLTVAQQGRDTSVLYWALGRKSTGFIFGNPRIKSVSDCKKVVTTPEGGSPYGWAVAYKKAFGADYDIANFNDTSAVTASVASGQADCSVFTYGPFATSLASGKAHILLDPRNPESVPASLRNFEFMESSYWGLQKNLESKRDVITRFLRANQQALQVMRTSTPDQLAALLMSSPDWKTYDQRQLTELLKVQAFGWAPTDGRIDKSAWSTALTFADGAGLSFVNGGDAKWSYESRVDMSYLDAAGT